MTKRRAAWIGVAVALALYGYAAWHSLYGLPVGINPPAFRLIQAGQTRPEVAAILGPPRTVRDLGSPVLKFAEDGTGRAYLEPVILHLAGGAIARVAVPDEVDARGLRFDSWESDDAIIFVFFGEDDSVVTKVMVDTTATDWFLTWLRQALGR